jgi:predicted ester cyclase
MNRRSVITATLVALFSFVPVTLVTAHTAYSAPGEVRSNPPRWLGNIPGLALAAPDPRPANPPVNLTGCTQTLNLFRDDPARVRRFVPAHYELGTNAYFGPGTATIFVSALVCDRATINGAGSPMVLSMVGAQLRPEPTTDGHPADPAWDTYNQSTLNFLPSTSWYLIAAHTNNPAVAQLFTRAGVDIEAVPDLQFQTDYATTDKRDTVTVPSSRTPYRASTTTVVPNCCFSHNHDWVFWHDGPQGRTGFVEHLHAMFDSACGYGYQVDRLVHAAQPSCGAKVQAQPGSAVSEFLGAPVRETSWALNHPTMHAWGYLTLLDQR